MLFTKEDLKKLVIPLIIEQLLAVGVGMIDTIMISSVGEAAVSGVSLVDNVNVLLINIFSAIATGGAVVAGHFLGSKDEDGAGRTAGQLVLFSGVASVVIMVLFLLLYNVILTKVFGQIEPSVYESAKIYLIITTLSFPALAVYNGCAALFRAMGNSRITMWIALLMNLINLIGNSILIYGCSMGVAGAAIATLAARCIAAVIIIRLLFNPKWQIHLTWKSLLHFERGIINKILYIGIPNGLENSLFQLGKIVVLSLVSTFGTYAIAANAISNTFGMFQTLPGQAINLAILAVAAKCVGAGAYDQTRYYTKLLMRWIYEMIAVVSMVFIIGIPFFVQWFHLSEEAAQATIQIVRYHGVCAMVIWPISFSLPNTLRAANDVRFTMIVAIISMGVCRIGMSYVLGAGLHMGVFGIWVAMTMDWTIRAVIFMIRYLGKKWTTLYHAEVRAE
ncbi:MAG: MATE family efflux transporter [bacterium]|nr:MATE family efflux transporter [bacterium]